MRKTRKYKNDSRYHVSCCWKMKCIIWLLSCIKTTPIGLKHLQLLEIVVGYTLVKDKAATFGSTFLMV